MTTYSNDEVVNIGNQYWHVKNLNTNIFSNGDHIPEAKSIEEWTTAVKERKPVWCNYNNQESLGKLYGKLYNFYAVKDIRNLAPIGFRIANQNDWLELEEFLGESYSGKKLKSKNGWELENGLDEFNFCALPGGYRYHNYEFLDEGRKASWWTADSEGDNHAWNRNLNFNYNRIFKATYDNGCGMSIRCIKI
jgi:uncharacterized protein (TIGR02145 family)